MTVFELKARLEDLVIRGRSNDIVKVYDGDAERMMPVTGMLYGGTDGIVELCSDSDDEEEVQS